MLDMNPMLLCDTYKTVHNMMYPEGLEYLVSYWVPRKSYFEKEGNQKMVWFGLQAFIKEYLVDYFEKNFKKFLKKLGALYTTIFILSPPFNKKAI